MGRAAVKDCSTGFLLFAPDGIIFEARAGLLEKGRAFSRFLIGWAGWASLLPACARALIGAGCWGKQEKPRAFCAGFLSLVTLSIIVLRVWYRLQVIRAGYVLAWILCAWFRSVAHPVGEERAGSSLA